MSRATGCSKESKEEIEGYNKIVAPFRTSSYDLTNFGLAKLRQVSFGDGLVLPKNYQVEDIIEEIKEPKT